MSFNLEDFKKKPTPNAPTTNTSSFNLDDFKKKPVETPKPQSTFDKMMSVPAVVIKGITEKKPEQPKPAPAGGTFFDRFSEAVSQNVYKIGDFVKDTGKKAVDNYKEGFKNLAEEAKRTGRILKAEVTGDVDTAEREKALQRQVLRDTATELKGAGVGAGKGLYDIVSLQIPQALVSTATALNDALYDENIESLYKDISPNRYNKAKDRHATISNFLNNLDVGLKQMQGERMQELGITAETPLFDPKNFGYKLASGAGSMGLSVGVSLLTKNPTIGAGVLGWLEGSPTYLDAKQKLREDNPEMSADDIEQRALLSATADTAGIVFLEKLGLDALFRSYGGGTLRKASINALTETAQETSQTMWSNLVEKVGFNKTKSIFEDVAETAFITMPIGFFGGAFVDSTGADENLIERRIKTSDALNIEATLKESPEMTSQIYADPNSKILTEKFAQGRIDDVAQKADLYKKGLGAEVRAQVDAKNTTFNNIVETGLDVVRSAKASNVTPDLQILTDDLPPKEKEKLAQRHGVPTQVIGEVLKTIAPIIRSDVENVTNVIQADDAKGSVVAQLENGASPSAVALELSQTVGAVEAQKIVAEAQQNMKAPVAPVVETIADITAEKQDAQIETNQKLEEIKGEIEALKKQVSEAPDRSVKKRNLKIKLAEKRKELDTAEQEFTTQLVEQQTAFRDKVKGYINEIGNVPADQIETIIDNVVNITENSGVVRQSFGKPLKDIIRMEVDKTASTEKEASDESAEDILKRYKDGHANHSKRGIIGWFQANNANPAKLGEVLRLFDKKAPTQKEKVKEVVAKKEKASIKEIAKETGILEPNVRRILGVGAKQGEFERVADGVYRIVANGKEVAVIVPADAREALPALVKDGFKADMVFLDIPYDTPAVKGGNRGVKYNFISVGDFDKLLDSVKQILRDENSAVIHMYSQAPSGMKAMQKYNDLFPQKGFKPLGKGEYQKTFADGSPVTSPNGKVAQPEGIIVFNQSGKFDKDLKLNFKMVRPKGYQTEKPAEMLKALIEMTTNEGDVILDPFAGSGVTGAEAVKAGRGIVAIEKDKEVAEKITKPRIEGAVPETESISEQAKKYDTLDKFIASQGVSMFHTTDKQFEKFDPAFMGSQTGDVANNTAQGFFFSDSMKNIQDFLNTLEKGIKNFRDVELKPKDISKFRVIEKIIPREKFINLANASKLSVEQAEILSEYFGNESGIPYKGAQAVEHVTELFEDFTFMDGIEEDYTEFVSYIKGKGYEGIITNFGRGVEEFVVFDPNKFYTKAELKDIWDKANTKVVSQETTPEKLPKSEDGVIEASTFEKMTKPEVSKLLVPKTTISDLDAKFIDKVGKATANASFSLSDISVKTGLLNLEKEGVFTDGYSLINDRTVSKELYNQFRKKYPNIQSDKNEEPPNWKNITPPERSKARIIGYYVQATGLTYAILSDGKYQQAVTVDRLAYVLKAFPKADIYFSGNHRPVVFEIKGNLKALVMPISEMPNNVKLNYDIAETKAKPAETIKDIGEKIGGARKDLFQKQKEKILSELSDSDIASMKIAELLPPLDYEALLANGTTVDALAVYTYFRAQLKRKPLSGRRSGHKLANWISDIKSLRQVARLLFETKADVKSMLSGSRSSAEHIFATQTMYEKLDFIKNEAVRNYTIGTATFSDGQKFFVRNGGKTVYGTSVYANSIEEAIELVKEDMAKEPRKKENKLENDISVFTRANQYLIAYKKGGRFIEFEVFSNREDALEAFKDKDKIKAYVEQMVELIKFDESSFRNRKNKDPKRSYRNGDVTADTFMNTFGFRGVEFGNWVKQAERQERLNFAYDALKDLAVVVGIPDRAISLNGELGFAFGARGTKGAMAHYEGDKVVINLTKENGSGTIAHEWWHALDNYFARKIGDRRGYITDTLKYDRPEVSQAVREIMRYIQKSDLYARSKKADRAKSKTYFTKPTELGARAFEVYVKEKLKEMGVSNDYLVNLRDLPSDEKLLAMYPYAKDGEVAEIVSRFDTLFDEINVEDSPAKALFSMVQDINLTPEQGAIQAEIIGITSDASRGIIDQQEADLRVTELWEQLKQTLSPEQIRALDIDTRFKIKQGDAENPITQERVDFLRDIKDRFKIDFDVHFVDSIIAGEMRNKDKTLKLIEAYGAYADNTIILLNDVLEDTKRHEIVHLTIENAHRIPILAKNGITKQALHEAQAKEMGIDYAKSTAQQKMEIEEQLAIGFENFKINETGFKGIIKKFYRLLKSLVQKARSVLGLGRDVIQEYYDLLEFGRDVNSQMAFFENDGILKSYIKDGAIDLRGTQFDVARNDALRRMTVARLQKKDGEDARLDRLVVEHNRLVTQNEALEKALETNKEEVNKKVSLKDALVPVVAETSEAVKDTARFTTRTKEPVGSLTARGKDYVESQGEFKSIEEAQAEVSQYLQNKATLIQVKRVLRQIRKQISDARKQKKEITPALRDVERKLKARQTFVKRMQRHIEIGMKRGASMERAVINQKIRTQKKRSKNVERLRKIYTRTKQATRTGAFLPIDYQKALTDMFDNYDFTRMTENTRKSLERTRDFFAGKKDEVSQNIAEKLKRLEKTPIADMTDDQIEALVSTIEHIYNLGVVKRKLQRGRDEAVKAELLGKVIASTTNLDKDQGIIARNAEKLGVDKKTIQSVNSTNISTFEAFRVADMIDGYGNYEGSNYTELQRPVAEAVAEANEQTDTILASALEDIKEFGETFTEEEQARMVYYSAIAQGGEQQAKALRDKYKNFNFDKALTEKEAGVLQIMRDTFKDIRPEIASTYESIKNIPFPDNDNYFPFKYDALENTFNIDENAFDFQSTKTKQGFTISREQVVDKVLDIDIFKVFARSLNEQIYYAKVQPALDTTREIINTPQYQKASGVLANKFWKNFIEDVSRRGSSGGFLDRLRGNISTATLGYKLTTVLIQPLAVFDAMSTLQKEFGFTKALAVLPKILQLAVSKSATEAIKNQSIALRERKGGQVEVGEIDALSQSRLSDKPYKRWYDTFKRHAFTAMKYSDLFTASAVWIEFRDNYVAQGMSVEDANQRADTMMKVTQASSNVADRAHVMNTEAGRFFLTFQTFVLNAFNNVRYDILSSNIKNNGTVKGLLYAVTAIQFVVYGRIMEQLLRGALTNLIYGGDDEDEETLWKKIWSVIISNIPGVNNFFGWEGNVSREGIRIPVVDVVKQAMLAVEKFVNGKGDVDAFLKLNTSVLSLFGIPAVSQLNQLIRSQFNPYRDEMGLNDFKTNDIRMAENIKLFIESGEEANKETISAIAEKVFKEAYTEGDLKYRSDKEKEVAKNIAVRKQFGFDNSLVNGFADAKNNNERKALFIDYVIENGSSDAQQQAKKFLKNQKIDGQYTSFISKELYTDLIMISRADKNELKFIKDIAVAETDADRLAVIKAYGDTNDIKVKSAIKNAYAKYGVISKELYNSIK